MMDFQEYVIENDYLKVTITSWGAQVKSVVRKLDGVEHIWQADMFIDGSLQSDVSPPVRVGNADTAFRGAHHLKTCTFKSVSDILTAFQLPGRG